MHKEHWLGRRSCLCPKLVERTRDQCPIVVQTRTGLAIITTTTTIIIIIISSSNIIIISSSSSRCSSSSSSSSSSIGSSNGSSSSSSSSRSSSRSSSNTMIIIIIRRPAQLAWCDPTDARSCWTETNTHFTDMARKDSHYQVFSFMWWPCSVVTIWDPTVQTIRHTYTRCMGLRLCARADGRTQRRAACC